METEENYRKMPEQIVIVVECRLSPGSAQGCAERLLIGWDMP